MILEAKSSYLHQLSRYGLLGRLKRNNDVSSPAPIHADSGDYVLFAALDGEGMGRVGYSLVEDEFGERIGGRTVEGRPGVPL